MDESHIFQLGVLILEDPMERNGSGHGSTVAPPTTSAAAGIADAPVDGGSREHAGTVRDNAGPTRYQSPPRLGKNQVYVPYDPEDQSDDEVVITSVYNQQMAKKNGNEGNNSGSNKGRESLPSSKRATPSSSGSAQDGHLASRKPQNAGGGQEDSSGKRESPLAFLDDDNDDNLQPPEPPLANSRWVRRAPRLGLGQCYRGKKISFCPWKIITNYPEWFVGRHNGELIQPYFRASELLRCQTWDFYYVWHPSHTKRDQCALVVPTGQFMDLLGRLNMALGTNLSIPRGLHSRRFSVEFGSQGTPLPRWLGHAMNKEAFRRLVAEMPPCDPQDNIYTLPHIGPQAQKAYLKKIDSLFFTYDKKQQKKNKADKSRQRSLRRRVSWGRQAKRVQRYLGLRKKLVDGIYANNTSSGSIPPELDLTKPAPFSPEGDVLFVSMDIESYEFNTRMVTEIGFGTLDTRDIRDVPPGVLCENWHNSIKGRHIRIREHASMVNRVHVQGCENQFMFGHSEFVQLKDIPQLLDNILQPKALVGERRKVILVGHGISSDLSFVRHVGYNIERTGMFLEIVDTQDLHRHLRKLPNQVGLAALLQDMNINSMFLHNGGNDAVYTLQAMLSLAVRTRQGSLRRLQQRSQPGYTPEEVDEEGWGTGGEESDGGYPPEDDNSQDEADVQHAGRGKAPAKYGNGVGGEHQQEQNALSWSAKPSPETRSSSSFTAAPAAGSEDLIWF